MTHADLVTRASRWLGATRGCALVLTEFVCATHCEIPDAIGWMVSSAWSILVECKSSRGDFHRDGRKPARRHSNFRIGQERWYLTPPGLVRPEEIPDGWGLLEAGPHRIRTVLRCPTAPTQGRYHGRGPIDPQIQARELPFLLSVYRRKVCHQCLRQMFAGTTL